MRKILILMAFLGMLILPVSAMEFTAPAPPPESEELMPAQQESFGQGLWQILQDGIRKFRPELVTAAGSCLGLIAVVLLASLLNGMPGNSKNVIRLVSTIAIGVLLLGQADTMIRLCAKTVQELSEYGKLLLPVITGALAAQGGRTGATALYAGTTVFNTLLTSLIGNLLVPMVYIFLALSLANAATGETILKKMRDFVKWLMTWSLKTLLYVFTGYMGITGVITGTADAAAVKAAKLTISGVVPVVGGILSDASEAVVVSAGVMKNAVGIYGLFAIATILISPFLQMGVQYLMLKLTAVLCGVFGVKEASELIENFSSAMGLLLGMVGTVCFLLLISTICFMKGMG
ncbi:MAG: stage III sporulation protein AE [Ruminococcaceae bacterium]|nr:stage III sporulation protein AE [Oscillospiraceae bacterium]